MGSYKYYQGLFAFLFAFLFAGCDRQAISNLGRTIIGESSLASSSKTITDDLSRKATSFISLSQNGDVTSSSVPLTWSFRILQSPSFEVGFGLSNTSISNWKSVSSANSTLIGSLSPSTIYWFQVRTTQNTTQNNRGMVYSNIISTKTATASTPTPTPTPTPAPSAPSSLTASPVSTSQINLQWMVTDSGNITGFRIEKAQASVGPYTLVVNTAANTFTYSITGLAASTTYYFRVSSFNSAASSSYAYAIATTLTAIPTPTTIPTPPPTPTPAPTPTPSPTSAPVFQNGQEWPASFRPYAGNSSWNMPLPENPILYSGSAAIVAQACAGGACGGMVLSTQEAGNFDYSHPVYFSSSNDPLVNTKCTMYCKSPTPVPYQIRIPAKARPAGGSDGHLAIVQPDGTEIDLWATTMPSRDWTNGDTVTFQGGATCGNFLTGTGFAQGTATAGGACLAGGIVRAAEIQAGLINHALFTTVNCVNANTYVYPASQFAYTCSAGSANIPLGARIHLDLTDVQIDALAGVSVWQKTLLHALHRYGAYVMDTGGGTSTSGLIELKIEDPTPYAIYAPTVPWDQLAKSWGWTSGIISGSGTTEPRYWAPDNWAVDFAAHLKVVDPCYAQGTCR